MAAVLRNQPAALLATRRDEREREQRPGHGSVAKAQARATNVTLHLVKTLASHVGCSVTDPRQIEIHDMVVEWERELVAARNLFDASVANEFFAEELPNLTPVYELGEDPVNTTEKVHTRNLPMYTGESADGGHGALVWLQKILVAAKNANLTHEAAIDLCLMRTEQYPNAAWRQYQLDHKTLEECVRAFEQTYCLVQAPDEALKACNEMRPNPNETWLQFSVRLRQVAEQAVRTTRGTEERCTAQRNLQSTRFMQVVPSRFRSAVEADNRNRAQQGLQPLAFAELASRIDRLQTEEDSRKKRTSAERQYDDYRMGKERPRARPTSRNYKVEEENLNQVDESPVTTTEEETEVTLSESGGISDEDQIEEIQEQLKAVFQARRNTRPSPGRGQRGYVVRQPRDLAKAPGNARAVAQARGAYQRGGAKKLADEEKEIPKELKPGFPPKLMPQLANIQGEFDRCMHCGRVFKPPHRMGDLQCPLRGERVMNQACALCGKGLHDPAKCLKRLHVKDTTSKN